MNGDYPYCDNHIEKVDHLLIQCFFRPVESTVVAGYCPILPMLIIIF